MGKCVPLHIVYNRSPFLQISRDLVNHLLPVCCVVSLIGVIADQLALAMKQLARYPQFNHSIVKLTEQGGKAPTQESIHSPALPPLRPQYG
jgi:hypothetical protein